jgi:hypothetical protein
MRANSGKPRAITSAAVLAGAFMMAAASPAMAQGKPATTGTPAAAPAPAASTPPAAPAPAASTPPAAPAAPAAAAAEPAKPAAATPPKKPLTEAQKKDAAKKAYKDAEAKLDKADYAGALVLYQEADQLVPGAAPKFKIAACLDKLGRVKEAHESYKVFLGGSPDAEKYKDKIAEAKVRMDALAKTPAKVKVVVTGGEPPPSDLQVALDGAPQQGIELAVPPGKHKLTANAAGYDTATVDFEVAFADAKEVSLALTKSPVVAPVPVPVAATEPPKQAPPPAQPQEPQSKVPAYVTLGLAGAGAIVGTVFGIQALGSKSDYEDNPTQESFDDTERNALLADMSFGVAITFGVTGVVLLLSSDSTEAPKTGSPTHTAPAKAATRPVVLPYVGPDGGGAAATFKF